MFEIKAKTRDLKVKREDLQKDGEIPAVFYGKGEEAKAISVSLVEFKKVWHKAGESSAVKLSVDGKNVDTLIHDVQLDPVKHEPVHVDFLTIDMNKKIQVSIPLEFVGVSPAVKGGIGTLVKVMHEVEIEALPKDLPQKIEADISKLATLEDGVLVSDLKMPAGVTVITPMNEVVASVVAQKEEKEEDSAPIDLSKIEVEKKGKKEEEAPAGE